MQALSRAKCLRCDKSNTGVVTVREPVRARTIAHYTRPYMCGGELECYNVRTRRGLVN